MCDTLNNINGECVANGHTIGEFILINKFIYLFTDPKRGDVIVFKPKNKDDHYIKRIIGIGGDTIEIKKDRFVYLTPEDKEEVQLDETYLNEINYGNTRVPRENNRIFNVPEGMYFVMGDNRAHSSDSRHCFELSSSACLHNPENAYITKDEISGKAMVTLWPFRNIKLIKRHTYSSLVK